MSKKLAFSSLNLQPALISNLDQLGYLEMTPIQAQSLPLILEGSDLIAQAKTGSGKTAAFGLGLLNKINPRFFGTQALVLCPTRELADQVAGELRRLARSIENIKIVTLCGGTRMGPQIASLEHGAHIIVGTPGRLQDHLFRNTVDFGQVSTLVLDEADRMIDMGFIEEIVGLIKACPKNRQTLLFSATFADDVRKISQPFMRQPKEIRIDSLHDNNKIEQWFYKIEPEDRFEVVAKALLHVSPISTLIFCNTKARCNDLVFDLNRRGFSALALHGDLEQRDRDQILARFSNKSCSILVATDVAARGLDIKDIDLVINVDVSHDPEIHIHRIGRTGRSDKLGMAMTLVIAADQRRAMAVEFLQQEPLHFANIADLTPNPKGRQKAPYVTIDVYAGKREKLRAGDFLGSLTRDLGLTFEDVGKIQIGTFSSLIAIRREIAKETLEKWQGRPIKGRVFKMRIIE